MLPEGPRLLSRYFPCVISAGAGARPDISVLLLDRAHIPIGLVELLGLLLTGIDFLSSDLVVEEREVRFSKCALIGSDY